MDTLSKEMRATDILSYASSGSIPKRLVDSLFRNVPIVDKYSDKYGNVIISDKDIAYTTYASGNAVLFVKKESIRGTKYQRLYLVKYDKNVVHKYFSNGVWAYLPKYDNLIPVVSYVENEEGIAVIISDEQGTTIEYDLKELYDDNVKHFVEESNEFEKPFSPVESLLNDENQRIEEIRRIVDERFKQMEEKGTIICVENIDNVVAKLLRLNTSVKEINSFINTLRKVFNDEQIKNIDSPPKQRVKRKVSGNNTD